MDDMAQQIFNASIFTLIVAALIVAVGGLVTLLVYACIQEMRRWRNRVRVDSFDDIYAGAFDANRETPETLARKHQD